MSLPSSFSSAAVGIARAKKERFILQMSEDRFRDEVVRPLLMRMGLRDGRDLCGPQEEGKDAAFVTMDPLGMENVYVLQTKKGPLNMSSKATSNVITAITQLRMASQTKVYFPLAKESKLPTKVVLCASGKINESAKRHIVLEVPDANLVFMDAEDLIPKIDELFPELWFGIDANLLPYLRIIKRDIEEKSESLLISEMLPGGANIGAATDGMFVHLNLYRVVPKVTKHRGLYRRETKLEEMPATGILSSQQSLFLVLGEAGSGKSTILRRLAYELSKKGLEGDEGTAVPVMVKAIDVLKSLPQSLVEICAQETRRITQTSSPSFTSSSLEKGKVSIFIDALDELQSDEDRTLISKAIEQFNAEYPGCKVVVTSRDLRYFYNVDDFGKFQTYRISPISYKQAEKIVDQLQKGKGVPPESSKEIIRQLQEVHGMDLNPLLVTVFVATTEYTRQDIPANITELFKKFTEMMLGRWDASKGLTQQFQAPLKDFILTRIAFDMHKRKVTEILDSEMKAMIESELAARGHRQDSSKIVDELVRRSGLLRISGAVIQFRHHLLQEFFAGRGIPSVEFLQAIVGDDWWRRAVVFYFGENAAKSSLLEEVIAAQASRSEEDIHGAALTIGLALQACYLAKISSKVRVLRWVIEALAKAAVSSRKEDGRSLSPPLLSFILYYLIGRDSVACKFIGESVEDISKPWLEGAPLSEEEKDLRLFWLIVGLIESGELDKANALIRRFRPSDSKLFLGLHLGCCLIQHHRVASRHQKQIAEKICGGLAERIGSLRSQLFKELQGELLEVRRGKVKLIGTTDGKKSETSK